MLHFRLICSRFVFVIAFLFVISGSIQSLVLADEKNKDALKKERGNPAIETMQTMQLITTGIAAYAMEHNAYPEAKDIAGLAKFLVPKYLRELPKQDSWGNLFVYIVDTAGSERFWLISHGSDGKPDEGLYNENGFPKKDSSSEFSLTKLPEDDIILSDFKFVQAPQETVR